jgi:hypothetical protein
MLSKTFFIAHSACVNTFFCIRSVRKKYKMANISLNLQFLLVPKSPTQIGIINGKSKRSNISHMGTFKSQAFRMEMCFVRIALLEKFTGKEFYLHYKLFVV